ncbi:MAG: hypothetical protein V1915_02795 [Candidatus Bathyarchaeota archaeon]
MSRLALLVLYPLHAPAELVLALIPLLLIPPVAAYLAITITGLAPVTSVSGVKSEVSRYIPVMAGTLMLSVILRICLEWLAFPYSPYTFSFSGVVVGGLLMGFLSLGCYVMSYFVKDALKRVRRNSHIFPSQSSTLGVAGKKAPALFLGVLLFSTLFIGIKVGADASARQALSEILGSTFVDAFAIGDKQLTFQNFSDAATQLSSVSGVTAVETISRTTAGLQRGNSTQTLSFTVVGIENHSRIYEGLTVVNGQATLGANDMYVVLGSTDQDALALGENASVQFSVPIGTRQVMMTLTLRVVGFVQLTSPSLSIALSCSPGGAAVQGVTRYNMVLVDWWTTMVPLSDLPIITRPHSSSSPVTGEVEIYLDRAALIDLGDIAASQVRVSALISQLNTNISPLRVQNNLQMP